jgi:Tol biopolymer transport system component
MWNLRFAGGVHTAMFLRLLLCALAVCPSAASLFGQSGEPKLFDGVRISAPVLGLAFSPDGKTLYLSQSHCHILSSQLRDGQWSDPSPMPFSGLYRDGDPFLSPDGSRLFFWSNRPLNGKQRQGLALWVAERGPEGWSEPRDLGLAVNGPNGGSIFPSVTADGTLYFASRRPDSLGGLDVYRVKKTANGYAEPENLGSAVNSEHDEWDAYIAPDESFLLFVSARPGGSRPGGRLFISTRENGVWSTPRDLSAATGGLASCCPAVSPDGRYFFFSGPRGVYRAAIAGLGLASQPKTDQPIASPEVFAEGVISTPDTFSITFSPDGNTAYFARSGATLIASRQEDGRWSVPAPLAISGGHTDLFPFLSRDASRLFFSSSRRREGQPPGVVLWTADRNGEGWSAPRDLGDPVNTGAVMNGSGSLTADGTLYFAARVANSKTGLDLFRARRHGTDFAAPENLGPGVNSPNEDREVYVAPDESYMIFTSNRPGGVGNTDLYISMRSEGAWSIPQNLGPKINSPGPECCATVSPDGKTLYYFRSGGASSGVYMVETRSLNLEAKASELK